MKFHQKSELIYWIQLQTKKSFNGLYYDNVLDRTIRSAYKVGHVISIKNTACLTSLSIAMAGSTHFIVTYANFSIRISQLSLTS